MQRILFHSNHLQESRTSALNCGLVKWDFFWSSWGHVQTKFWENAVPHRYVLENMHTGPRQSSDRNVHHKLLCQTPLGMTLRAAYWTVEKAKCGKTAIMAERKFVYLLVTALSCSESGPNTKKKKQRIMRSVQAYTRIQHFHSDIIWNLCLQHGLKRRSDGSESSTKNGTPSHTFLTQRKWSFLLWLIMLISCGCEAKMQGGKKGH